MYNLISVERTDAPEGAEGNNWYRYVIGRDSSRIVGHRRGTVQQVTEHARTCVEELNARARWPGATTWAAAQKKKARK